MVNLLHVKTPARSLEKSQALRTGLLLVSPVLLFALERTGLNAGLPAPGDRSGPQVVVDQPQHDFGRSDVGVQQQHGFVFRNVGDEPLTLARGSSTCGCCTCVCVVRLPEGPVAPGESARVTLQWQSNLYVGPFRQTATIKTNDATRPDVTLAVKGRFTGPVGVVPSRVVLDSVRSGEPATRDVRLYNYLPQPLEITGHELGNPQTAAHFAVTWKRLAAEQVRDEGEARGGYHLRISVRPGMPVGPFRQTVVLKTTSQAAPRVEIPVEGKIVSDVTIAGRGWNARKGELSMGTIQSGKGAVWPLLIVVRGPHASRIQFGPRRCDPEWLRVELGPTRHVAERGVSVTRMNIRVPPDCEPSAHLGGSRGEPGRIVIGTSPPALPDVDIRVRFAVGK